jgi:hypothetical protein
MGPLANRLEVAVPAFGDSEAAIPAPGLILPRIDGERPQVFRIFPLLGSPIRLGARDFEWR